MLLEIKTLSQVRVAKVLKSRLNWLLFLSNYVLRKGNKKEFLMIDLIGIKKAIKDKGVSYRELAAELKMPLSKLSKILNGKQKLYAEEYLNVCKLLGVSINYFVIKTKR